MPQVPDCDSVFDGGNTATNIFCLSIFNKTIASIRIQPVPDNNYMEEHNTNELLQCVNEESGKYYDKDILTFQSTV